MVRATGLERKLVRELPTNLKEKNGNLRPCFGTGRSRVRTNEGFSKEIAELYVRGLTAVSS